MHRISPLRKHSYKMVTKILPPSSIVIAKNRQNNVQKAKSWHVFPQIPEIGGLVWLEVTQVSFENEGIAAALCGLIISFAASDLLKTEATIKLARCLVIFLNLKE